MFDIKINDDDRHRALHLADTIPLKSKINPGDEKFLREKKYTGFLAELTVYRDLAMPLPEAKFAEYDDGHDITIEGVRCDIKTMLRTTRVHGDYINNIDRAHVVRKNKTQAYLCCSINKNTLILTVCGFIRKADIDQAWLKVAGTERARGKSSVFPLQNDTYEVPMTQLVRSVCWEGLKTDLQFYFRNT